MTKKIFLSVFLFFNLHILPINSFAQPSGFIDEVISDNWIIPAGLTFDANGRMYVWEKSGKVFVVENGVKSAKPIIDISEEVLDYGDHGLNGLALDPDFLKNGYVYLMYAAKRNHVLNFGKHDYKVQEETPFQTTIGRITRYTLSISSNFTELELNSRKVLLGETPSTGIPILVDNHGVGSLVFGLDGTLLATIGDASLATDGVVDDTQNDWFKEAISLGFIKSDENINAYKSQYLNSLDGKLIRINPNTGDGLSSNPFYEAGSPRSPKSRVWAFGLRNPFRFSIKPNTGSTNLADGKPGTIYMGDVGWSHREEMNVATKGGLNFGWPTYEGIDYVNKSYQDPKFFPQNHQKPVIDWRGTFAQGIVDGDAFAVGSPLFKGNKFSGIASIGGIWYNFQQFPREYQNLYFHGDYEGWIKAFKFDTKGNPTETIDFVSDVHPTSFAINPKDGAIYYTNYFYPNIHEIRRLSYNPNANRRPTVVQSATPIYGKTPLAVNFKASDSKDPEGTTLKYEWNFGDGQTSNEANPNHTYKSTGKVATYGASVKVTDAGGLSSFKTMNIFVDNTPPQIISTSIDKLEVFENTKDFLVSLNAQVSDAEHTKEQLSYLWSVLLYHDDHIHFVTSSYRLTGEAVLTSVPCDAQTYFYKVTLTATDVEGLSSTYEKIIKPNCVVLSVSPSSSELNIAPNPTPQTIDIFPLNDLTNKLLKATLYYANGSIIMEKEAFWQEIKPILDSKLIAAESGMYLLKISTDGFSKTFKVIKD
jgi:glucose/arabinose dehydrogenase